MRVINEYESLIKLKDGFNNPSLSSITNIGDVFKILSLNYTNEFEKKDSLDNIFKERTRMHAAKEYHINKIYTNMIYSFTKRSKIKIDYSSPYKVFTCPKESMEEIQNWIITEVQKLTSEKDKIIQSSLMLIKELINKGENINGVITEDGETPLTLALECNSVKLISGLLNLGASCCTQASTQKESPLIKTMRLYKELVDKINIYEKNKLETTDVKEKDVFKFTSPYYILNKKYVKYSEVISKKYVIEPIEILPETNVHLYTRTDEFIKALKEIKYMERETKGLTVMFNNERKLSYNKIFNLLLKDNSNITSLNNNNIAPLIYASTAGLESFLNELLKYTTNPIITQVSNILVLSEKEDIRLIIDDVVIKPLSIELQYKSNQEILNFEVQTKKVTSLLGVETVNLKDNHDGIYQVKIYQNSNEGKLLNSLIIKNQKVELVNILDDGYKKYLYFKHIDGYGIDVWKDKQSYIESILKFPVIIDEYDESHALFSDTFNDNHLVIIQEHPISTIPNVFGLKGSYLKSMIVENRQTYMFKDADNKYEWIDLLPTISEYVNKRLTIHNYINGVITLIEGMEESIPRLLELKDSKGNFPQLERVKENGNNKIYFYTFLPELDLSVWKEKSRKTNFKILFNEPDKVYKLGMYDKTNVYLYDENFSTKQYITLHEYAKIPSKEELMNINIVQELSKDNIFWGYGIGSKKYYTPINSCPHMMIIGATGSGKSNFINGVILSLLNSVDKIKKMYLIDLKSGIEFNRYKDLQSDKIDVFSRGTKPSKLLAALYEVEAEMYLREEYMVSNNITTLDKDPIFVIIDEFAQINLMYARGDEIRAKDEINDTLIRIATRARSANIKLIVQTQDPRSIGDDLRVHLMSRILLKTGKELDKEFTLQNSEIMDELGIKHTKFDKGRFVFEDYNDGDAKFNELQFPFINPELNLHMRYASLAQEYNQEDESIYDQYKDYLKAEYDYLANTKLFSNSIDTNKIELPNQVVESVNMKLPTIDFNFDTFLEDDKSIEEVNIEEFAEVYATNKEALIILKELKGDSN